MNAVPSRSAALCALGLSFLSVYCRAAEAPQLPSVVVTATRTAQPLANVLSDVRIINSETIRDAGAVTLTELLQLHGGAEIAANGGPGQNSSVFLRGSNAGHVVMLVDGVRLNSASAGLNAWENIPLAQIERIEIVRGAASGLYGADAIGGVVQIFTRQGERTQLQAGAGSWRTREANVGLGRVFGPTRLSVQAGYRESQAFSATNPANGFSFNDDRDPYRNKNLGLTVEHEWASGQSLIGRALNSEGNTSFDCGAGADDVNRQRLATYSLESRNRLAAEWRSSVRFARGTDDSVGTGNCAARFRTDQDQFSWQNDVDALGGQIAAGSEWRREKVSGDTAFTRSSRTIASAFGGYSATLGSHLLQAALRIDDNSQFGARSTGNVGYGLRLTPLWRLSARAGTAFKTPSFNDLYFPFTDFGGGFTFSGNPSLRPERSRYGELEATLDAGALRGALVLFQNQVRDLIAGDASFSTVINVNRARLRGATLNASFVESAWNARAEFTRQEAIDADAGTRLPRRARQYGSASLGITPGPWRASAELVGSGSRFDNAANSVASRMGGYVLLNVQAALAVTPEFTLSVRLNNATDKPYELAQGYNTPGRNVFVALEYAPR